MNTQLLDRIEKLAGCQRDKTFRKAAEFILEHKPKVIVETGCYRGIDGDGQSTLILALLAKQVGGDFFSFDTNPEHIAKAEALLKANDVDGFIFQGESVSELSGWHKTDIGFAYLDSFDHDPNNPGPCQRHQLAEVGAILGKMTPPCAILLDDHVPKTGGKTALSAALLAERGWKVAAEGLQLLFTKT